MTEDAGHEKLIRKAYTMATSALRDAHKEEFVNLQKAAAAKLGIDWTPRKSAEEKARESLNKLLADHPELADELVAKIKAQTEFQAAQ